MEPGKPESQRDYVHVFIMPSATPEKLDELIKDLHAQDTFPERPVALPVAESGPVFLRDVAPVALVPHAGRGFQ